MLNLVYMVKKSFWKYFFDTLKESRWLLLRYFVIGIYLILVGIISNRLNLNHLTYYNSMITMMFFGEMISFGFIEGFGIYINQHIKDLSKSKKYAKCGFYFTLLFLSIIIIIFASFPNFILKNIFNLNFEYNLAFYYLMIIALFFNTLISYYNHIFKKIGEYKPQMIISFVQSLLIVFGLFALYLFGKLFLVPIGVIYIVTNILCTIISNISLSKNKTYSINLLKIEKVNLTKNELKIITFRALSEVVWEIGYFFISLFILKMDIIVYNQYCYFENALDILNGIFFAFVSVVSIKICRDIGDNKMDEAYTHGKYSILSTFVIWIFYTAISLALFIPFKKGMNIDLQSTAFVSLILFLTTALFRFSEWNLGTYVLGQSEYFSKAGLILESVFTSYWILLFLIANFLPASVYVIYSFIAFENIFKTIYSFIVFKRKKWLVKSE